MKEHQNFKEFCESSEDNTEFKERLNSKIIGSDEVTKIDESSLSRLHQHSQKHDMGTITAFRSARDCGKGELFTKNENKKNNNILKAKLLKLGYGVTAIDGTYIENFGGDNEIEVKEKSFIVVDLLDKGTLRDDLVELGQDFQQDSVTYQPLGGAYLLLSSNKCPLGYPGKGKIGVVVKLGKPMFGKSGEFHSKISGRPFVFESLLQKQISVLKELSISEIRSVYGWLEEEITK